jgi:hypothetical protein
VNVDEADHKKRRTSTEKHKTTLDAEKKKNLARQALKERRAQVRHEGRPEENSPNEDDDDDDDVDDDSEGMAACLNRLLQPPPQAGALPTREEALKELQSGGRGGRQEEPSSRHPRGDTPLATTQGRSDLPPCPPKTSGPRHWVKTSTMGLLTCGRATVAASSQGGGHCRSSSPKDHREGRVELRPIIVTEQPRASTHGGGSRPAGCGTRTRVVLPMG